MSYGKKRELFTSLGPWQPGNRLKYAILGFPNTGKSLLYNALTQADHPKTAVVDNAMFSTLVTQIGQFKVPDERLDYMVKIHGAAGGNDMTAIVSDGPALVDRAWTEEEGEGHSFLSKYYEVDVILHLLRGWDDEELTHYHETVDPLRDATLLNHELMMHDLLKIEKGINDLTEFIDETDYNHGMVGKSTKWERWVLLRAWELLVGQPRKVTVPKAGTRPVPEMPTQCGGMALRYAIWDTFEIEFLQKYKLLTGKPVVYILNVSDRDYLRGRSVWMEPLKEHITEHLGSGEVVLMSATFENIWVNHLKAGTLERYKRANPWHKSAVPLCLFTSRRALKLITIYVANPPENTPNQINFIPVPNDQIVQPYYLKDDTAAIDAAALIDTEVGRYFNRLVMYSYHDLCDEDGNFERLNEVGKHRIQNKRYPMNDGDVCEFMGWGVPPEELPPKTKKKGGGK
jgi:ribosome-binding ATPase YchF (GTP1/OBG family)